MTCIAQPHSPDLGAGAARHPMRGWPGLTLALFGASAVFSAACMAWLPGAADDAPALPAAAQDLPHPAAAPATAATVAGARKRARRCDNCGVVESIRRVEAATDMPAGWEFTVRMRDGSTRLSTSESAGAWRHGDAIMLIGGPVASRP